MIVDKVIRVFWSYLVNVNEVRNEEVLRPG